MTEIGMQCLRDDPQLLRNRLGAFVRAHITAKALARLIGCDVRTAENIRQGHWPSDRLWSALYSKFGDEILDAVFRPHVAAARIEQECLALERQLEAKRMAARALATVSSAAEARRSTSSAEEAQP